MPTSCRAEVVYKGHAVEVVARRPTACSASHIVVVVHDDDGPDRRAEYIAGDLDADAALDAGIELAHALVDGRLH